MSAREVLESKLARRHPSDVAKWLDDLEREVRLRTLREVTGKIKIYPVSTIDPEYQDGYRDGRNDAIHTVEEMIA